MNLSILLKKFREEKGLTIKELAEKSGVPTSTISEIERGANKTKIITLEKITKGLHLDQISREKIFATLMPEDIRRKIVGNAEIINLNKPLEIISIPLFNSASAGNGYLSDETPIGSIDIPMEYSPTYYEDVIAITVKGDSMEPTLSEGTVLIVKRGLEVPVGDIGVFFLSGEYGETVVKRLKKKNGIHILESDNSSYDDIIINSSDIIRCGKVIRIIIDRTDKKKHSELIELIENLDDEKRKIIETILKGFDVSKK